MIRLLASEFLRARSRRTPRLVLFGLAVAILLGVGIATAQSTPPSAGEIQRAEQMRDRELKSCLRGDWGPEMPPGYSSLEEFCEDNVRLEYFVSSSGIMSSQIPEILLGSSWLVSLIGAILGATLIGADWAAGTVTTLLTWEPRRVRVLIARGAVAVAVVLAATVALQALFALTFRIGVSIAGTVDSPGADLFRNVYETVARNSVGAAVFCVVALSIATLTRSTVGALGVIGGYLIIVEGFVAGLIPEVQRWLLLRATIVFLTQEPMVIWNSRGRELYTIGLGQAGMILAAWVLVLSAVALISFRARDVT